VLARIINDPGIAGIHLYFGDAIDGWTAVYPMVSEQMDKLATRLSKEFQCLVLTLGSYEGYYTTRPKRPVRIPGYAVLTVNMMRSEVGFLRVYRGRRPQL